MASQTEMSLLEHIQELRKRVFRAVIAIILTTAVGSIFVDYIVVWMTRPLGGGKVIVLGPTEAPVTYFKIALVLGFGAALPYLLYQIYSFVAPGLFPDERKTFIVGIPAVLIFFVLGAVFAIQIIIPTSIPFLMGIFGKVVEPTYSLETYLSFVATLMLWMGLIFQTPLIIYAVTLLGVVTPKQLRKGTRLVIFLATIFAAIITPTPDPVNLLLVTVPFIALYGVGLLLSGIAARQRARRTER